jgi:hypothetical protein
LLFGQLFSEISQEIFENKIVPKHSSGATADRIKGNRKYDSMHWTQRLESVFPLSENMFPNYRAFLEEGQCVPLIEPGSELPVRVITVPKTLKTPRIIAIEPTCMQYMQQGILYSIVKGIQRDYSLTNLIGWKDQTPNQRLALLGSLNGELATLDLKEASDRVSNLLVKELLNDHPLLAEAVDACRSMTADVPGHGVIPLSKFASMGSALTFPFEAMCFISIIFVGMSKALNKPINRSFIKHWIGQVRVFGDDIIVPVDCVPHVITELESFGFRVNGGKSFWTGRFRESCGKEYYGGHDVSIVRCRSRLPASRRCVEDFVSTASFRNQLYQLGFRDTVAWLDRQIQSVGLLFPVVESTSPIIGRWDDFGYTAESFHPTLHVPLVRGHVVSAKIPVSRLDGWFAMMKCFLLAERLEDEDPWVTPLYTTLPSGDREHLQHAGRPVSLDIKTRMAPPY